MNGTAVEILLSTGARWGEVAALEQRRVLHCRITFQNEERQKTVPFPISESLFERSKNGAKTGVSDAGLSIGSRCHQTVTIDVPDGGLFMAAPHLRQSS